MSENGVTRSGLEPAPSQADASGPESAPAAEHRITRSDRASTVGLAVSGALFVVLFLLPWWDSDGSLRVPLVAILYYLALAQMWNLLAGFAGLVSIGQQMFVGIGVYTLLSFAEDFGVDPYLSVLGAGAVAAVLSLPVAALAFRLRGGYFAIGTWVIAEVFRLIALESDFLGGANVRTLTRESLGGYSLDTRNTVTYLMALGLAAGATAIVVLVLRSRLGLALRSIRDNPEGARGLGVSVTRAKLVVWVIAAFWTGMTGAVILLQNPSTRAESSFSVLRWTALVVFIAVIGGVGSTTGPIIGVGVYWFMRELLEDADEWRFIILGLIAAAMAILAPRGVYGQIQKRWPVQFFPVRRRLVGPGLGAGAPGAPPQRSAQAGGAHE